jgi:hypothetical protein
MKIFPRILGIPSRFDWEYISAMLFVAAMSFPAGFMAAIILEQFK